MSFLFFLVVPSVLDFLLTSPAANHGIGRMLQGIDGTVPLPNVSAPVLPNVSAPVLPNMSAPTLPGMALSTPKPDVNDLLPGGNFSGSGIDWDDFNIDQQEDLNRNIRMMMIKSVVYGVIHIAIICAWAARYKCNVTDRRHGFPTPVPPQYSLKKETFPFGTFGCFEDCQTCLFGYFCTPCRLGDTMTQVGASSYWKMVFVYIIGVPLSVTLQNLLIADQMNKIMAQLTGTDSAMMSDDDMEHSMSQASTRLQLSLWIPRILWIFMCILMAIERKKLRRNLGGKGKNNLCMDFCCYCWCFCCTIIQDARTVDGAADTAVQCPCRLVRLNKVDAVGEPVSVSEDESSNSSDSN